MMLAKKPTNLLINLKQQHLSNNTFKRGLLTNIISRNNDCTITATVKGQYYHHRWYNHCDDCVQHQQVRQYYNSNQNNTINRNYYSLIGTNNKRFDLICKTGLPRQLQLYSTDTAKSPSAKKRKMVSFHVSLTHRLNFIDFTLKFPANISRR